MCFPLVVTLYPTKSLVKTQIYICINCLIILFHGKSLATAGNERVLFTFSLENVCFTVHANRNVRHLKELPEQCQ